MIIVTRLTLVIRVPHQVIIVIRLTLVIGVAVMIRAALVIGVPHQVTIVIRRTLVIDVDLVIRVRHQVTQVIIVTRQDNIPYSKGRAARQDPQKVSCALN